MSQPHFSLPDNVLAALAAGNKMQAVRLLREQTGLGLHEAKDAVESYVPHDGAHGNHPAFNHSTASGDLPHMVVAAWQRGHKIEAVRLLREQTGLGLKEAKDTLEAAHIPANPTGFAEPTSMVSATTSPGAVSNTGGRTMWVVGAMLLAAVAYYFLVGPS